MSFGSDSPGGANEGVGGSSFGGSGGGGLGIDYGFTGMGTTPGLTAGWDSSPGYTFGSGTDQGFTVGPDGYDIGGGLGTSLGGFTSVNSPADYSFNSLFDMSQLGQSNYGMQPTGYSEGMQVSPSNAAAGYGLSAAQPSNGFGYQQEPGFFGSKAQKVMSFLSKFNPVTSLANTAYGMFNSPDPAKALAQGLIGMAPGGWAANMGYNAATSPSPAGYAATQGAGYLGGMLGGAVAGQAGAQLGSEALGGVVGGEVGRANASAAGYGPFGSGSPAEAGFASGAAGLANGPGPSASAGRAPGGTERNWTDTLMSIGSGIYGMRQADAQRQLSQQAIGGSAPWTASGGNAVAGEQLKAILAGDFTNDAGFKAAQRSAARASCQQPGGMAATAAAQAALKYQNDRIQALGAPAGVGFSPAAGYQTAVQGVASANDLASKSLGSIGFGVNGGNTGMPPWLQTWLIQNGMGGPKGG